MLNIRRELSACRKNAKTGFDMAQDSYEKMQEALQEERSKLREADRKQKKINRIENDKHFRNQLKEMDALEKAMISNVESNLNDLKERMDDFTIVLYGRTMAGKSTLMEILTHGNGASIGKGAQRTTRDVRPYTWNGLKVFDVPGTCSFGGKEDDTTAYEAAKSADLALFLITDDAPQPSEADRLAELKKLGKPVLGIVNVKQVLSEPTNAKRKIELKSLTKKINDKDRLGEIIRQFKDFGQKYSYNFDDIPFVTSHLQAAYLSQEERENDSDLYRLSNFEAVEKFILEKVKTDGKFIRIKTFVDSVALPMQNAIDQLYRHSAGSYNLFQVYTDKIKQLNEWSENFNESARSRYDNFIERLRNQLNSQLENCVNQYYEDSDAGEKWKDAVDSLRIDRQCQSFIERIGNESTRKLREFSDELTQDLRYTSNFIVNTDVHGTDTTDYGSILRMLSPLSFLTPWGLGITIGTYVVTKIIFNSKEDNIRKAKKKLREALEPSRDEIISKVRNGVMKIIENEIFGKQVDGFRQNLFAMRDMIGKLSYAQNILANTVNDCFRDINFNLFVNAKQYIDSRTSRTEMKEILTARTVGNSFIVFSTIKLSDKAQIKISALLGEKVSAFKVGKDDYWQSVFATVNNAIIKNELVEQDFSYEPWGKMSVIYLPDDAELSDNQIQLIQQVHESPVVNNE